MYRKIFTGVYLTFCVYLLILFTFTFLTYLPSDNKPEPVADNAEYSMLASIRNKGLLRFITLDKQGDFEQGLQTHVDYLLAEDFAEYMQLDFDLIKVNSLPEVEWFLLQGKADIAIGIEVLPDPDRVYSFSKSYRAVTEQLVYHKAQQRPESLVDLEGSIVVAADSHHAVNLKQMQYPQLDLLEQPHVTVRQLLTALSQNKITYTLVNDLEYAAYKHIFPELRVAFSFDHAVDVVSISLDEIALDSFPCIPDSSVAKIYDPNN